MARINLLPWRALLREKRRKRFLMVLAVLSVGTVAGLFAADQFIDNLVEQQLERNDLIRSATFQLDGRAEQIDQLKVRREQLLERMQTIGALQSSRSSSGIILEQLARSLPEGVHFTDVKMTDGTIVITGVAQSNTLVAQLMRNLDASHWLETPELNDVKADPAHAGGPERQFQLTVREARHTPAAGAL